MNKIDLVLYETPAIAKYISIGWIQNILAKYVAKKVNRKVKRYEDTIKTKEYLKAKGYIR